MDTKVEDERNSENDSIRKTRDFFKVIAPKGQMEEKHKNAHPYYMFFNVIPEEPETHSQPLSITFPELLDRSLGELSHSLQIHFMVELEWLLPQYAFAGYSDKPLTIIYGDDVEDLLTINARKPNIHAYYVKPGEGFGLQHTKLSILCYEDMSLRIVISTANLYSSDWANMTQGLWLSPRCPQLADPSDITKGESPTGFKRSLIQYLKTYSLPCLTQYIEIVQRSDFSQINVFLVASVPGGHFGADWGQSRMGWLTRKHCEIPAIDNDKWDFVLQASSVGNYGKKPKDWLTGDFQVNFCMSKTKSDVKDELPPLRMIYPCRQTVLDSIDQCCGPYSIDVHTNQTWLEKHLHEWRAGHSGRNRAMPHIKSYLRLSPDSKKAAYFLLTSSNMSKSAWGKYSKKDKKLYINSYELGVLFIPKYVISETFFSVELDDPKRLPVPYDLPPTPYTPDMTPWIWDLDEDDSDCSASSKKEDDNVASLDSAFKKI